MKRYIQASSDDYVVACYDATDYLIGFLYDYRESRGHATLYICHDVDSAKIYSSEGHANRAIGYYRLVSDVYDVDSHNSIDGGVRLFSALIDRVPQFRESASSGYTVAGCNYKGQEVYLYKLTTSFPGFYAFTPHLSDAKIYKMHKGAEKAMTTVSPMIEEKINWKGHTPSEWQDVFDLYILDLSKHK